MSDVNVQEPKRRPPRRGLRNALMTFGWMSGLVAFAVVGLWWLIGRPIDAPVWLRDRIEARIEATLGGAQIEFGAMEFLLREGLRPRVRLSNVVLTGPQGRRIVELADIRAALALRPLMAGEIQPRAIRLTGAYATLRRNADGQVQLFLGQVDSPVNSATDLPTLLRSSEAFLLRPGMAALNVVSLDALTLRYEDARIGRGWTLDGGRIRLDRDGDAIRVASGFSVLGGGALPGAFEMNYTSRLGETAAAFGFALTDMDAGDIAVQSVALNWLDVLRAPISGALRGAILEDGRFDTLSASLRIGAGAIQPNDRTRPIPFDGAQSYFSYEPATGVLKFDELSIESDWGAGVADGVTHLKADGSGRLDELTGQFRLSGLRLNPNGVYPEPLEIAGGAIDFRMRLDPFRLDVGRLDLGGAENGLLRLNGGFRAAPEGWDLALDGAMDRLTPARLMELWPASALPKPREWVATNLTGGAMTGLSLSWRAKAGSRPRVHADFDFEGAEIRYLRTLPAIRDAAGHASFADNRFAATVTQGEVDTGRGLIDVAGSSFTVLDTSIPKGAPGMARMRASGGVQAVMAMLNREPLQVLEGTGLPVNLAHGRAALTGELRLPIRDHVAFSEMAFDVAGELTHVGSDVLVPGHRLMADELALRGDQSGIEIAGLGTISGIPANVVWHQPLGERGAASEVSGTIVLSPDTIDAFGIALPQGSLSGEGEGAFTLALEPGQAPELDLSSDLAGLRLRLPEVGWAKGPSTRGRFNLKASLGDKPEIESIALSAAGLAASGTVDLTDSGGLRRAVFDRVRLDGWLDAPVVLVGNGRSTPAVQVRGGTIDLRRTSFGTGSGGSSGGSGGGSGPIEVTLNRLQITDTIALTDFRGSFRNGQGIDGSFRGRVNGQTEVTGRVAPDNGGTAVVVKSGDAGGVFRAAGILEQGRGGSFDMVMRPVGANGVYDGDLRVTNTRVKDAPAIAALLNAASIVGLVDEMTGQGILFTEVEARFRLSAERMQVLKSSAIGPSMGLSMDGDYDPASGNLDMRGVISPIYLLNAIGAPFARKGEGLIGLNYRLRGPAASPKVRVNPLSALAPGALRDIFRPPRANAKSPVLDDPTPRRRPDANLSERR